MIEHNVVERIPGLLPSLIPGERILLFADRNTWTAAGERLSEALGESHSVECCLLRDDSSGHIHASVDLVEEILSAYPDEYDGLAAVGSGTVNDLTRAVAHRRERPYFVLATAASMNGYTSAIVALLENGLKTTRAATPPVAVFADPLVLAEAPAELTLAGLGDLISKPYCGCDWKIASLVRSEYHCDVPDRLLSVPFALALDIFPKLADGDPEASRLQCAMAYQVSKEIGAMATVMEGKVDAILITGGIAHNPDMTGDIKKRVDFIAPVLIYPGEDEMRALAQNGLLLRSGKINAREYTGEKPLR